MKLDNLHELKEDFNSVTARLVALVQPCLPKRSHKTNQHFSFVYQALGLSKKY